MGINLSGLLGPLVNAGTQAAGTYQQSQAQAGQQQIGALIKAMAEKREQEKEALAQAIGQSTIAKNNATVSHLGAQTAAAAKPKPTITHGPGGQIFDVSDPTNPVAIGPAAATKPIAQGHVVDPVTGDVKFFDPTKPPSDLRVHPASKQDSFTPFQGTDAEGKPVVRPFNTKTGQFGAVADVAPKIAAGSGVKDAKAQTYTDMMNQSLPAMEQLVDRVRPDRITLAMKNPAAGNVGLNQDEQTFLLNFRTALAGALHQESGARLSHEQLEFGINRFAPTVGDTPQTRRQKIAAMREMANERTARVGGGGAAAPATARPAAKGVVDPFADLVPKRPEDE